MSTPRLPWPRSSGAPTMVTVLGVAATAREATRSPEARRAAARRRRRDPGYTSLPGEVAQLVEHTAENRGVAGSSPALAIHAAVPVALATDGQRHAREARNRNRAVARDVGRESSLGAGPDARTVRRGRRARAPAPASATCRSTVSHHSASEPARHVSGHVLDRSRRSSPPRSSTALERSAAESRNGPGASGSGRSSRPSSSALRPAAVIQSFALGSAQTATAARPPGRRTRAISAAAASITGGNMSPQRQRMPSTERRARVSAAASSTANASSAPSSSPSSALAAARPRPSRARRPSR